MKFDNVARVELIDKDGRKYANCSCKKVGLSLQDNERTLKIFID